MYHKDVLDTVILLHHTDTPVSQSIVEIQLQRTIDSEADI